MIKFLIEGINKNIIWNMFYAVIFFLLEKTINYVVNIASYNSLVDNKIFFPLYKNILDSFSNDFIIFQSSILY